MQRFDIDTDFQLSLKLTLWGSTNLTVKIPGTPNKHEAMGISYHRQPITYILSLGTESIWRTVTSDKYLPLIDARDLKLIESALQMCELLKYGEVSAELAREKDLEQNILSLEISLR